jgi:hypothetical protein
MNKIRISDIKSTKDKDSIVSQLSKKELDSTVGGGCIIHGDIICCTKDK